MMISHCGVLLFSGHTLTSHSSRSRCSSKVMMMMTDMTHMTQMMMMMTG